MSAGANDHVTPSVWLPPRSALCDTLAELQYRRRFYINRLNMNENALRALVRRAMGWRADFSEAERTKLNARAASLVKAMVAEKETKTEDAEVAAVVSGDVEIFRQSREPLVKARKAIEKEMVAIVRQLPVYEWAKGVRGFGDLGLAVVVAEAGDLGKYPNPAKLWKRLGLAPYKGRAASAWRVPKWTDGEALGKDDWIALGYSGARLGQVYGCVTESLIKLNRDKYRAVYDHAKAGKPDWTPIHAHKHALRVMTKELLLDLWRVWHGYAPRQRECAREGQTSSDAQCRPALADSPLTVEDGVGRPDANSYVICDDVEEGGVGQMTLPETHSAMKLAAALHKAGLADMARCAEIGHYHDFLSPLDFPDMQLLSDLREAEAKGNLAAKALIARHLNGDFDATKEEGDQWAYSEEGREAMKDFTPEQRAKLFGVTDG